MHSVCISFICIEQGTIYPETIDKAHHMHMAYCCMIKEILENGSVEKRCDIKSVRLNAIV